jgi:hypothetical protein
MNLDNIDLAALDRDLQEFARQQRERGWWKRNWRWFLPVLLLALIAIGAGAIYWSLFIRIYNLKECQSAMQAIAADKELQNLLGQPIKPVYRPSREFVPSAQIEDRRIDIRWNIAGPKGGAKAHTLAELRMGEWQTIIREVTLPDGKKISLTETGGGDAEAPAFNAPKAATQKPESNAPAPEINMSTPPPEPGNTK